MVASGGPYATQAVEEVTQVCVAPGYTFTINDPLATEFAVLTVRLTVSLRRCWQPAVNLRTRRAPVPFGLRFGCTDETACNYDAEATTDDGL